MTTARRAAVMPDVPPMADTLPGFEIHTGWGLTAPVATPPERVARFNQAFVKALESAEVKSRFATLMAEPSPSAPQQCVAFLRRERATYPSIVRVSGATIG